MLDVETHFAHQFQHALLARFGIGDNIMHLQRLCDDIFAGIAGIQRGIGVLEHHLNIFFQRFQLCAFQLKNISALIFHRAGSSLVQLDNRAAQRRLAAAGLTDDTQRLSFVHIQRHIAQRMQDLRLGAQFTAFDLEFLGQAANLHQRLPALDLRRRCFTHGL